MNTQFENHNLKTVTLKLERREVIDLLIASRACTQEPGDKWEKLNAKLKEILNKFDAEHPVER